MLAANNKPASADQESELARNFIYAGTLVSITLVWLFYHESVWSMIRVWINSRTYNHCFLIVPISAFLVWWRRVDLKNVVIRPSGLGILAAAGIALAWYLGDLASVSFVKHAAIIAVIPVVVISLLGIRFAWAIAFPLAYLFLSVPFGDWLIPPLMNFTAKFSVMALQLTGIPVVAEATYISIPEGDFRVVEACAGLRYLIASFALGTLYAYLAYTSVLKRATFILASLLVPVIANGMRAYGIILVGHYVSMERASGIDHLIGGTIFFGIVILLMFWVGSHWIDEKEQIAISAEQPRSEHVSGSKIKSTLVAVLTIAILLTPGVLVSRDQMTSSEPTTVASVMLPPAKGSWAGPDSVADDWRPTFKGAIGATTGTYQRGKQQITVTILSFPLRARDTEMIRYDNSVVDNDKWFRFREVTYRPDLQGLQLAVKESLISSGNRRRMVWHWYEVGGKWTGEDAMAKILILGARLSGAMHYPKIILVTTDYSENPAEAREDLTEFMEVYLADLKQVLSAHNSENFPTSSSE